MGLFNRKKRSAEPEQMSEVERAGILRDNAIEYVVSLPKADKDRFYDAVDLIWQGYDQLNRVKTKDEKSIEKEAKAMGMTTSEADDLNFDLLDEPDNTSIHKTGGAK